MKWRYEWVTNLDQDVFDILLEELTKESTSNDLED